MIDNKISRYESSLKKAMFWLVSYIIWYYLISYTTFENSVIRQILSGLLCLAFIKIGALNRFRGSNINSIWYPYVIYTILGCFLTYSFNIMFFWIISLIILHLSICPTIHNSIPYKYIVICGLIFFMGQMFQWLYPSIYFVTIAPFFNTYEQISSWHSHTGYCGFTYQLGYTGGILLIAEGAAVSLLIRTKTKYGKRILLISLILLVVGVFLTGKRTYSVLSLLLPALTYFFQTRNASRKSLILIVVTSFLSIGYFFLLNNYEMVSDIKGLNRISESIQGVKDNEDISNNRGELANVAWRVFEAHPILGVGPGQYQEISGEYTTVHNSYLQILCEQGIIGIILFVLPLVVTLFETITYSKKQKRISPTLFFCLYIQLFYIFYSFTGNTNSNLWGFVTYFISISMLGSYRTYLLIKNCRL